jgi:superfamily II DNA/RNA helicase
MLLYLIMGRIALLTDYKGIDIPDIKLVVQYQLPGGFCVLYQRFGRTMRDRAQTGKAVLIAEPKYFDDTKKARAERVEKARVSKELKKRKLEESEAGRPPKRGRVSTEVKREDNESQTGFTEAMPLEPSDAISNPPPVPAADASKTRSSTRHSKEDLKVEPVMDQFVNAHLRSSIGDACRHAPGNQFFCNPAVVEGTCRSYIRHHQF